MDEKSITYEVTVTEVEDQWDRPALEERWRLPGKNSAGEDRPSRITRRRTNSDLLEEAYLDENGGHHCTEGPAIVDYYDGGIVIAEHWMQNDEMHREIGPAETHYDPETGIATVEHYYQYGKTHRENGPAIVERHAATGIVIRERWFLQGEEQPPIRFETELEP